jgi:hypothetical protein
MRPTARERLLRDKVEFLLSPTHLLHHEYLVSRVVAYCRISADDVASLPVFLNQRVTAAEVLEACQSSSEIAVSDTYLCLGYAVFPTFLYIRKGDTFGTVYQIGDFVRLLIGGIRHRVLRAYDGETFVIEFGTVDDSMAAWRALRIVPFAGRMLNIEAGWAPIPRNPGRMEAPQEEAVPIAVENAKAATVEFTWPARERLPAG